MRTFASGLLGLLIGLGLSGTALAQETEPNSSCHDAQDLGALDGLRMVQGSLDAADASPVTDVDYFRITVTPDRRVRIADRAKGTVTIGVFAEDCGKPITLGSGQSGESRIFAPPSGVLIVAVGVDDDDRVRGTGSPRSESTGYELEFSDAEQFGEITGQLLDAATNEPLFGVVNLERCIDLGCFENAGAAFSDEQGRFLLPDIAPGSYRLRASRFLGDARETVSVRFRLGLQEALELGEVFLARDAAQCPPSPR